MVGCIAIADSQVTDIEIDDNELEDAQWFSRDEVDKLCKGVRRTRTIMHQSIRIFVIGQSLSRHIFSCGHATL